MKRKQIIFCLLLVGIFQNALFSAVKTSFQSGNFGSGSTWVGGVAPAIGDDIIIATGHTVTLDYNAHVKNITIEAGGNLVNSTFNIIGYSVNPGALPQYINNGTHNGPGKFVLYDGGRTQIQGTGTLNCSIEIVSYGIEILSTCNLTINGNVQHAYPGNSGMNMKAIIEAWEGGGGNLTINGNIVTNIEYGGVTIDNHTGTIIVNGNVTLSGSSITGTGSILRNLTTFNILGDLTLGPYYSYVANFGEMVIGGDLLGANENETFFLQAVNSIAKFGGAVFPDANPGYLDPLFDENFASAQPNIIEYNGNISQVIENPSSGAYSSLVINNNSSNGVSLNSEITLNGDLSLTNGLLTLGDFNFVLGDTTTILGSPSASNMIVATGTGELKKTFNSPDSFIFPVGDNDNLAEYSPVTLNITSGTFSDAYVGINLLNQPYPGVSGSYLSRYWNVNSSGITDFTCDAQFNYVPDDVTGNENIIYCFRVDPTTDLYDVADVTLHQLTANDLTSFGIFTGKSQPNPDAPTAYNVTGGGEYCEGEPGLEVGLDNTEADASYTLYQNNQPIITDVQGTGNALSFGLQSQGVYTVSGTNDNGTTLMLGEANIIESAYITPEVAISTASTTVCEGEEITIVAVAQGTGQEPLFEWFVNGLSAGENSDTYSYIPEDQDVVQLQMTSSSGCATVNPVMSNEIIFQVIESIIPTAEISASPAEVCQGEEMEFTATVSGAGDTPIFQWFVNGEAMSIAEPVMTFVPNHGDAVQLILSSSASCASPATVESNIVEAVVYELPEVSWETFKPDTFCIFWDAVAITGGLPEGGEYSGPGVADNTFDPEEAGIGEHELTYSYTTDQGCTAQASHIVFVDYCTSLSQSDESKQEIRIYPNPASHELHLDLKETTGECRTITIYNNLGIAMHRMINPSKQKHTITLSNWPDGIYHISFDLDSDMISKQFILSK
jgi:hypothetical protein